MTSLIPTGERTAPGLPDEEYWFARHEAAYAWIADAVAPMLRPGAVVVDAGAGEGYGAQMLRTDGRHVVGLEYDAAACAHIRGAYPRVSIIAANLSAIPLASHSADMIVSLQVIEHLWDLPGFLADCRRILRPGAPLVVTTPNRVTFSPRLARGQKPLNPFHVEEFDAQQVHDLLAQAGFAGIAIHGLHHGPRLADWEARHGSIVAAQVAAGMSGAWPPGLRDMVRGVTAEDFVVDEQTVDEAQDLIAVARAER